MTFEQFQATRKWSDDLCEVVGSDQWGYKAIGNLYLGALYIEQAQPHVRHHGAWNLLIEREEWYSDNLPELERRLYDWAVGQTCSWLHHWRR